MFSKHLPLPLFSFILFLFVAHGCGEAPQTPEKTSEAAATKVNNLLGAANATLSCKINPDQPKDYYLQFEDLDTKKRCEMDGSENPAYIIVFRHCDRRFHHHNGCENKGPCFGGASLPDDCQTNDCSTTGIKRSWALAKWLNCFAEQKNQSIAGIVGQVFESGFSNRRPTTAASIMYQSLQFAKTPIIPCYDYVHKVPKLGQSYHGRKATQQDIDKALAETSKVLHNPAFENKIVAIVTNHGGIPTIVKHLTGVQIDHWAGDCFDAAIVIGKDNKPVKYALETLSTDDPCTKDCNGVVFKNCTLKKFGDAGVCQPW